MSTPGIQIIVTDYTKLELFEQVWNETLTRAITVCDEKVQGDAQVNSPVYDGLFRNSIQNQIERPEAGVLVGHVFAGPLAHAPVVEGVDAEGNDVEFGRRPGARWPNVGAIRRYVERVIGPPESEVDHVTYLVGRKIQREGIRAKAPIKKALQQNAGFINDTLDKAIADVFEKV